MALLAKVINTTLRTTTGSQSVTGAGFTPKLCLVMLHPAATANGGLQHAAWQFGAIRTSPTQISHYVSNHARDATGATSGSVGYSTADFLRVRDYLNTVIVDTTFTSFDSDGITFTVDTTNGVGHRVSFLFLSDDGSGSTLQSFIGQFNANLVTGTQDVTGIGFDNPDCVIFFQSSVFTSGTQVGVLGTSSCSLGFGTGQAGGTITQGVLANRINLSNPTLCKSQMLDDACIRLLFTTPVLEAAYLGGITNGFRLQIVSTGGAAYRMGYIALKGVSAKVLNFATPNNASGNASVTGAGFKPAVALFSSMDEPSTTSIIDNSIRSHGWASGSANQSTMGTADEDGVSNATNASQYSHFSRIITTINPNHASPTVAEALDFVSFGSDGFTYNKSTTGPSNRIMSLVLGPAPVSDQTITLTGIASSQAFGSTTVSTPLNQTVTLTGIASAQAFGSVLVSSTSGPQTFSPVGIVSSQAFGNVTMGGGAGIHPIGIPGADVRDVTLVATFDEGSFDPQYTQYKIELTGGPDPRSALAPFGTTSWTFQDVLPGDYLGKWSLTNNTGTITAETQSVAVRVGQFGNVTMFVPNVIVPTGIASAQNFGNVFINQVFSTVGIASSEAFGTLTMPVGPDIGCSPVGIISQENFGVLEMSVETLIIVEGIASEEAFGDELFIFFEGAQILILVAVLPGEEFGTVSMALGDIEPSFPPIQVVGTVWVKIPQGSV